MLLKRLLGRHKAFVSSAIASLPFSLLGAGKACRYQSSIQTHRQWDFGFVSFGERWYRNFLVIAYLRAEIAKYPPLQQQHRCSFALRVLGVKIILLCRKIVRSQRFHPRFRHLQQLFLYLNLFECLLMS